MLSAGWMWSQEPPTLGGPPDPATSRSVRPPQPNPDATGQYHVGDGVTAPRVVFTVEPEFTAEARKAKVQGDCLVGLTVDEEGRPQKVTVVRSIADSVPPKRRSAALSLDAKAIEAVKEYRFKPAMFGDKPVPVEVRMVVDFQIF